MTENKQQRPILIASFSAISAPARRGGPAPHFAHHSPLISHHCLTPFLFDTNKAHKISILTKALMKIKEKQFSIRYKFVHRGTATLGCALRFWVRAFGHPHQNKCAHARLPMLPVPRGTNHQSPITTPRTNAACLGVPVMLSCPAASRPKWFAWFGSGA